VRAESSPRSKGINPIMCLPTRMVTFTVRIRMVSGMSAPEINGARPADPKAPKILKVVPRIENLEKRQKKEVTAPKQKAKHKNEPELLKTSKSSEPVLLRHKDPPPNRLHKDPPPNRPQKEAPVLIELRWNGRVMPDNEAIRGRKTIRAMSHVPVVVVAEDGLTAAVGGVVSERSANFFFALLRNGDGDFRTEIVPSSSDFFWVRPLRWGP